MPLAVIDASLVTELVTRGKLAEIIKAELNLGYLTLIAPQLLDIEVMSALRGLAIGGKFSLSQAERYIEDLREFPATREPHAPLLWRIWELRDNFTAYDATYIALAEANGARLYTIDAKLKRGHKAEVKVLALQ